MNVYGDRGRCSGKPVVLGALLWLLEMVNINALSQAAEASQNVIASPSKAQRRPKMKMYNTRHKQRDLDRKK